MDQRSKAQDLDAEKGQYTIIKNADADDPKLGMYDRPLPCIGCGIGWFSFLLGFGCPLMWYYATILYLGNDYRRDPRERAGLACLSNCCLDMYDCCVNYIVGYAALVFFPSLSSLVTRGWRF